MPTNIINPTLKIISDLFKPLVILILAILLWQNYFSSRSEEIIEEQLNKTTIELSKAESSLLLANCSIDSLNIKIEEYSKNSRILRLERDSLLLKFKRETALNWSSLQNIINQQKVINAELIYLKKQNKEFE